jgi:hypothetical protein
MINERDATIADQNAEIASRKSAYATALNAITELALQHEADLAEIARLNAIINPPPTFLWGDATRQQFLGNGFSEPFPISYESEFYPSSVAQSERPNVTIDYNFVLNNTMPNWRDEYPDSPRWISDIEWANSGGVTAAEVAKMLPGYQAARAFADAEGRGLKLGAYGFPRRWGVDTSESSIASATAIYQPILDLLDECILTLYPIYTDIAKSRRYIQQNIASARLVMPGKKLIVLGWDTWHSNVGAPLSGTPVSPEWQRMFLEEVHAAADGYAPWLKAAAPQPTNEPWWLETLAWKAAL